MSNEREADLDRRLRATVTAAQPGTRCAPDEPVQKGYPYTAADCLEYFDAQATSRHLDLAARRLTAAGRGYYSIGSAGHEGDVAVSAALRVSDPALLHYRSGAFFVHRSRRVPDADPVRDVLLGVVAAASDPISGGRHKVFGSKPAAVIPMTSTIASHVPRAVGLAFALDRAGRLGRFTEWPSDAVVLCSFGDASANHSTAAGAINAAIHTAHQRIPMPVLFVCEDNGIGISVPTPPEWIEHAYGSRPGMRYFSADGCNLLQALSVAELAVEWVREQREPAFLRLRTVRLLGHAGSDVETSYRRAADVSGDLARDPLTATARLLVTAGVADAAEVLARYDAIGDHVAEVAESVAHEPKLTSPAAVTAPLAPARPDRVRADVRRTGHLPDGLPETGIPATVRTTDRMSTTAAVTGSVPAAETHGSPGPGITQNTGAVPIADEASGRDGVATPADSGNEAEASPATLAQAINRTLSELLERDDDVLVFGEDVGRKGGVYGVTKGLQRVHGARRVFDTLLDEQSVLGTALGAGLAGFVPIPEIQYLAYLHNALDQIRGEAATLQFFATGQYRNPLVARIAAYAYQKGFGGHFHNDNSVAALRDIPGVVVASPARADDAAAMLRTCVSAARVDGRVCIVLEPIALYHTRDLYRPGDDGWLAPVTGEPVDIGQARIYGDGTDLTIVTFANGVPMSLRAAERLSERGIRARVLDLRWLAPLPEDDLLHHARATGRVLVADETRRSGGVSESVCAALLDAGFDGRIARVTSADSFVPLGPATGTVLLDEAAIVTAAEKLAEFSVSG
ncbi:2-oxoisovalerate dehydrogenase E1 component [Nocardia transvalensis]|uniref:2-oxoisovalerate dehydrogenase E1 component n=1 Tax=Nocardia transvalensis TaxID=37333 RepID=A0A7W9UK19_9NOCA|nr:thiamine pyrophosphate-dependent enzyme [Nocardia transvalensis]MBB5915872.1 2-oxoisovalerate dehydrogenase E1 component [Nocardia transvalensis]